ncbi:MAG: HAD-IA family hydrolase [Gaiellaceae bacterium]
MRFADLEAITLDAFGTLIELEDPAPRLARSLAPHGLRYTTDALHEAFRAEVAHYLPRSSSGRDPISLSALRVECVGVFLAALAAPLEPEAFVDDYMQALRFRACAGVRAALERMRARGLALAVVSNWDIALEDALLAAGIRPLLDIVVSSAAAGAEKPDPAIFRLALSRLGVAPQRALHVGDRPVDEQGARAAGMAFLHAPLHAALEQLQ